MNKIDAIQKKSQTIKKIDGDPWFNLATGYGKLKNRKGIFEEAGEKSGKDTNVMSLSASEKDIPEKKWGREDYLKGTETVLLVDDEETLTDVGKQILVLLGYDVMTAKSGRQAIDIYERNQEEIDVVILDMIMPGTSGGETFDNLKRLNPDIKVLLSSGFNVGGEATDILKRGCNGFIQKPFGIKQLSQKVREILDQDNR